MKIILLFLAIVCASCASMRANAKTWDKTDTMLETATILMLSVDYLQTIKIVKACVEINPVIGKCGERINPHVYFGSVGMLHVLTSIILPPAWRNVSQGVVIGTQTSTVFSNYKNGIGVSF